MAKKSSQNNTNNQIQDDNIDLDNLEFGSSEPEKKIEKTAETTKKCSPRMWG